MRFIAVSHSSSLNRAIKFLQAQSIARLAVTAGHCFTWVTANRFLHCCCSWELPEGCTDVGWSVTLLPGFWWEALGC